MVSRAALCLALAGLLVSCGDDTTRGERPDITDDAGVDFGVDVSGETGVDATGDADVDAVPDACEPDCPYPAICDESGASPRCVCPDGYADPEGDGRDCQDIDECATGADDCAGGATCVNSIGGFYCDCEVGSIWDGGSCAAVAERRLAAGDHHFCERRPDSSVWCWGNNRMGQLGDGTTERRSTAVRAGESNGWRTVAAGGLAGDAWTCALAHDGGLWCWGRSLSSGSSPAPVQVVPELGWDVIDLGATHGCGVKGDGTLWCWGYNTYGQMGTPSVSTVSAQPVQVGEDANWQTVSTGDAHSCALRQDGTLWCWGINQAGEVGIGSTERQNEPVQVGTDDDWSLIEAGAVNTCGIRTSGSLWCWGSNVVGQVGTGEQVATVTEPSRVGSDTQWRRIEVGGGYTCGIRADGSLWCWGNLYGFATTTHQTPRHIGNARDWLEVAIFSNGITPGGAACGLHREGRIECWGLNDSGELALGTFGDKGAPARVGDWDWQFVEARSFRTYAIRDDGTLWGWGSITGSDGVVRPEQEPVSQGDDSDWRVINAGEGHQCGLRGEGALWCWGYNSSGALGLGDDTYYALSPTRVGSENWREVAVGGSYFDVRSCGIRDDGALFCWGEDPVGDGTRDERGQPTRIGEATDWLQVSVGSAVCGVRDPGTVWCWGGFGGDLDPAQIGTDEDWLLIDAGISSACGIREPGTLWCWEDDGEPEQIGTAEDWLTVEELQHETCGLRGEGSLWCWGTDFAAMAEGRPGALTQPTQIEEASDWTAVSVGGLHVCALRADNSLWCWGEGQMGRLGHGDAWRDEP